MVLTIVVPFLDEEQYLDTFLGSLAVQTLPPDRLLLVDDGSTDASPQRAASFAAEHPYARVLRRPRRAPEADRLAAAHELRAFEWALTQTPADWDIAAKLDADLRLTPRTLETVVAAFAADPRLGVAGAFLGVAGAGATRGEREPGRSEHVAGATKFYRQECYEAIAPIPAILGWDTIDELRARMHGWRTRSLSIPDGNPVHLRPMGQQDGLLRAWRRWGACAYGYGEHPLHVLAVAVQRAGDRPAVLGGANYVLGWAAAAARRRPRAEPDVRAFGRRDQLRRLRSRLGRALIRG